MRYKLPIVAALVLLTGAIAWQQVAHTAPEQSSAPSKDGTSRVQVTFSDGHETDPRDMGRPVILVASALGVPADVFREAFSHVHPAPAGQGPSDAQVHENKRALLSALSKYGVTNDRLDEVSNYYRYVRSRGEMWPTQEAEAYALVKKGKITGFVVTGGGSGYSSNPTVNIPGFKNTPVGVHLSFNRDFDSNGSVASITLQKNN